MQQSTVQPLPAAIEAFGRKPDELATYDGSKPHLVMDLALVERAYRRFAAALPDVRVHYAMKCNPMPGVLQRLHGCGCGFEIASAAELAELELLGIDPADVIYSNPVKSEDDITAAAEAGVWRFAADSRGELAKLAELAPGSAVYVRLAQNGDSIVASEGKFGVPADQAVHLLRGARQLGLRPYGLAFHVGSQMLQPAAWGAAIAQCSSIMHLLYTDYSIRLQMLNIGGGFPARYDEPVLDLSRYGTAIREALGKLPYAVEIIAEPGRALVAEAGAMVARIIGRVDERGGRPWLHLNVGAFNGLMEALETQNTLRYPLTAPWRTAETELYHVTGPSCDSQDTLLYEAELPGGLQSGDYVIVGSAGAYTVSYASRFNGFEIPAVHCID